MALSQIQKKEKPRKPSPLENFVKVADIGLGIASLSKEFGLSDKIKDDPGSLGVIGKPSILGRKK